MRERQTRRRPKRERPERQRPEPPSDSHGNVADELGLNAVRMHPPITVIV